VLQQQSFRFLSVLLCNFSFLHSINCRLPALLVNHRQHKHLHQLHQLLPRQPLALLLLFLEHLVVKLLSRHLEVLLLRCRHS
jgi:hypothetical protein